MNEKLDKILSFKIINNMKMYDTKELHKKLEIKKDFSSWIKNKLKHYNKITYKDKHEEYFYNDKIMCYSYWIKATQSCGAKREYMIAYECLCDIIHMSRKTPKLKPILDIIGENNMILKNRKEEDFFNILKETLSPLNINIYSQYSVQKYRLDGYIKEFNLAIEFDEKYHSYQIEEDNLRENTIKDILNCKFIRCSESNSINYNIGLVIKEIMNIRGEGYGIKKNKL